MSYDDFMGCLMLYLEIDDAKIVLFDFAVNKHGMLSTDIYNQEKKLNTVAVVEKEFFSELKEHVFYWFNYDFLKDKYVIDTLKNTNNSVDIWFSENKDISDYTYKVVYTNNVNDSSSFEKVDNPLMSLKSGYHGLRIALAKCEH